MEIRVLPRGVVEGAFNRRAELDWITEVYEGFEPLGAYPYVDPQGNCGRHRGGPWPMALRKLQGILCFVTGL